ncbi:hypothetical protein D3C71_1343170 [compost metagenome]
MRFNLLYIVQCDNRIHIFQQIEHFQRPDRIRPDLGRHHAKLDSPAAQHFQRFIHIGKSLDQLVMMFRLIVAVRRLERRHILQICKNAQLGRKACAHIRNHLLSRERRQRMLLQRVHERADNQLIGVDNRTV